MYIIEQEIRDLIDKSCLDGHGIDQIGGYGGQFLMCSSKMWLVQTTHAANLKLWLQKKFF